MYQRIFKMMAKTLLVMSLVVYFPAGQSAEPARSSEGIYQVVCQYCHDTGIGPQLKGRQLPSVYIQHVARNGLNAMPAFRPTEINDQELAGLAAFIESSKGGSK